MGEHIYFNIVRAEIKLFTLHDLIKHLKILVGGNLCEPTNATTYMQNLFGEHGEDKRESKPK